LSTEPAAALCSLTSSRLSSAPAPSNKIKRDTLALDFRRISLKTFSRHSKEVGHFFEPPEPANLRIGGFPQTDSPVTAPTPCPAGRHSTRDFYSTMPPSRNRRNPHKTNNRCTVYSTMKRGGSRGRFSSH